MIKGTFVEHQLRNIVVAGLMTFGAAFAYAGFDVESEIIVKTIENSSTILPNRNAKDLKNYLTLSAEKVNAVASASHTMIVPEYSANGLNLKLSYDEVALKNPLLILKNLSLMEALIYADGVASTKTTSVFHIDTKTTANLPSDFRYKHAMAELITNANAGSPTAEARWFKLQSEALLCLSVRAEILEALKLPADTFNKLRDDLIKQNIVAEEKAQKFIKNQSRSIEKWRTETGALNNFETQQDKLNDLILKNDRKGVRQLLEAYLPWALMEPVEANTWKLWLEAIEHPRTENAEILLRGVDYATDKVQRLQTPEGLRLGFMSTVLTKNQGSYTRRLRSLSVNRIKNGELKDLPKEAIRTVKISDQLSRHASEPVASNFISFTSNPKIAAHFSGFVKTGKDPYGGGVLQPNGGLMAVKVDPRRMVPNFNGLPYEIEYLAPLIIFPDEVVMFKEGYFGNNLEALNLFVQELQAKTGATFEMAATPARSQKFFEGSWEFAKEMHSLNYRASLCSKIFN